jgi:hypothetical protein
MASMSSNGSSVTGFPDVPRTPHREVGSVVLHWVVQRNALTGALITFRSFADYADAERHQAELEAFADPLGRTNVVAIESLPSAESPTSSQNKRGGVS